MRYFFRLWLLRLWLLSRCGLCSIGRTLLALNAFNSGNNNTNVVCYELNTGLLLSRIFDTIRFSFYLTKDMPLASRRRPFLSVKSKTRLCSRVIYRVNYLFFSGCFFFSFLLLRDDDDDDDVFDVFTHETLFRFREISHGDG